MCKSVYHTYRCGCRREKRITCPGFCERDIDGRPGPCSLPESYTKDFGPEHSGRCDNGQWESPAKKEEVMAAKAAEKKEAKELAEEMAKVFDEGY